MTGHVAFQPAGRRGKHAAGKPLSAPESRLGWSDVLRVLQDEKARSVALAHYRTSGWTPEDFGQVRTARAVMADALARAEDALEWRPGGGGIDRARVRALRQRLERELWP
ncbi:MAG: hypothetical protein JW940_00525 [Polyangiaceae bacterium]|nr:hypothetical protein [Polyangiaceae bacterium]